MRLTCPNCGAQYEVPDEVIPSEGRDVQCSSCGDTWFQNHANHIADADQPEQYDPQMPDPSREDLRAALRDKPAHQPEVAPSDDNQGPQPVDTAPVQQKLDSSVKDILRQEAELEAQLRADEVGNTLESQPDLGLDDIPNETERRALEARNRMSRIRGATPETEPHPEVAIATEQTSRRGLLPDIEEINSTLRADGDGAVTSPSIGPATRKQRRQKKSGFTRGFALAVLLASAMFMVYSRAPQIAQSFPQANPALNSYVASVAKARLWLDAKIGDFIPKQGQ